MLTAVAREGLEGLGAECNGAPERSGAPESPTPTANATLPPFRLTAAAGGDAPKRKQKKQSGGNDLFRNKNRDIACGVDIFQNNTYFCINY